VEGAAAVRAALPYLLGIVPFGLVIGVTMVAAGLSPAAAMAMSVIAYAGASMLAATQLLAADSPLAPLLLAVFFINLRFMMYSVSLRPHLGSLPPRWKLVVGYLLADNAYAMSLARFTEHPDMRGKLGYFLGAAVPVWLSWQVAVGIGIAVGAGLPTNWRLEFAAPLAFIALTIPFLRDRALVGAAISAGATAVAAADLPARLGLVAAAIVGVAVGLLLRKRT
jgi:predicted branched-subunit amino acid permease